MGNHLLRASGRRLVCMLLTAWWLGSGGEAGADQEAGTSSAPAGSGATATVPAPPAGSLDRLLQLPESLDYGVERRSGSTRGEWRTRFRDARGALEQARAALAKAQQQLEGVAEESDAWLLAPPGVTEGTDAPLSYRLRQEIRRQRGEVKRAEQRLRDLEIEAELAGVPPEWRLEPATPAASPQRESVSPRD